MTFGQDRKRQIFTTVIGNPPHPTPRGGQVTAGTGISGSHLFAWPHRPAVGVCGPRRFKGFGSVERGLGFVTSPPPHPPAPFPTLELNPRLITPRHSPGCRGIFMASLIARIPSSPPAFSGLFGPRQSKADFGEVFNCKRELSVLIGLNLRPVICGA